MLLACIFEGTGFPRLLEGPGFFPEISRTWEVRENEFGPGKSRNLLVVQINQHAFYVQNTLSLPSKRTVYQPALRGVVSFGRVHNDVYNTVCK